MPPVGADQNKYSAQRNDGRLSCSFELSYGSNLRLYPAQIVRTRVGKQCNNNVFGRRQYYLLLASVAEVFAEVVILIYLARGPLHDEAVPSPVIF